MCNINFERYDDMENDITKKIPVEINGVRLTVLTNEDESSVRKIAEDLDARMSALRQNKFKVSLVDAALLCAMEKAGDRLVAERTIRSLEAQVSLCEMTMRNLRDEISELKSRLHETESGICSEQSPAVSPENRESAGIISRLGLSESPAEEKISALEKYLESRNAESGKNPPTRAEKIKFIESLLREGLDANG